MDVAAIARQAAAAKPMPFTCVPPPKAGLTAHVDGDYCAYFCAGNDDCDPGQARRNFLAKLKSVKHSSGATNVILHLTHPVSTKGERYLAATVQPYQDQRKSGRKPKNWAFLREYMEQYDGNEFTPKVWNTREADDGIAYVAHTMASSGKLAVISTRDKDMRMLPGRHVIWTTSQLVEVPYNAYEIIGADDEVYGHKWFWLQMLMGDTADYIPGIPGCGKQTAAKILDGTTSNNDALPQVLGAYRQKYTDDWADRFVEQACLLWLRTDRYADPTDFLTLCQFGPAIHDAAKRLNARIKAARAELEGLKA